MLTLGRKVGEKVEITTPSGEVIVVCLVRVGPGHARIGFCAAPEVSIVRTEAKQKRGAPVPEPEPVA